MTGRRKRSQTLSGEGRPAAAEAGRAIWIPPAPFCGGGGRDTRVHRICTRQKTLMLAPARADNPVKASEVRACRFSRMHPGVLNAWPAALACGRLSENGVGQTPLRIAFLTDAGGALERGLERRHGTMPER